MIKELCVVGHPSALGGADTELDHQIRLWRTMGIEVYICHTGGFDENLVKVRDQMLELGCHYIESNSWKDLEGFHTISFCNGNFLSNITEIKKYAKSTTFVNCMTWNFAKEIEAQQNGMIDFHLYQTQHQFQRVSPELQKQGSKYTPIMFKPYFDTSKFPFTLHTHTNAFRFGRISRPDPSKFHSSQVWIWETMTAPTMKEGIILGWDNSLISKVGQLPGYVKGYKPGEISAQEFYDRCEVIIMNTDTFENLPRVGFEAMASGCVLVVNNRGGWRTLVADGTTGWLCDSEREFVYKSSRAAFEKTETIDFAIKARNMLEKEWGTESSLASWLNIFDQWNMV